MRVLWLIHTEYPSFRAQNIQVAAAASELTRKGLECTVIARSNPVETGHRPIEAVRTHQYNGQHAPIFGWYFRWKVAGWAMGPPGVVIVRDLRRAHQLLPLLNRHKLILEAHELPSWECPTFHPIEKKLLARATALVCNSEGTLDLWQQRHTLHLPSMVIQNATHTKPRNNEISNYVRALGSLHRYKGHEEAIKALSKVNQSIQWIGDCHLGASTQWPKNQQWLPAQKDWEPWLHGAKALLLILADNHFGRNCTSPLKLWDYLASHRPLILPDLPSIRQPTKGLNQRGFCFYEPSSAQSLRHAVERACEASPREPFVRSWSSRADEYIALLEQL